MSKKSVCRLLCLESARNPAAADGKLGLEDPFLPLTAVLALLVGRS